MPTGKVRERRFCRPCPSDPRPRKSIFDPVHGSIVLDASALGVVATASFQRLWRIRQTGLAHLVFPGANHTRLEHSLGVYWVARQMSERLGCSEDETRLAGIAGLLHDVGHGPFSHTLDLSLRESLGTTHEGIGRRVVLGEEWPGRPVDRAIGGALRRANVSAEEVADLIDPVPGRDRHPLLRRIVHGAIDADRLDYLQRDAHYTGVAHGAIDALRLLETVGTDGRRIWFAEKGRGAVEGFLVGRALMYDTVYYHKTVRAAELMVQAAVERANGYPDEVRAWFSLTDIDLLHTLRGAGGVSRSLVEGIERRQLLKRAFRWPAAWGERASVRRRLERGPDRRAMEDELADRLGAPRGTVLFDVSGVVEEDDARREWAEIAIRRDDGPPNYIATRPPWRALLRRRPTDARVAVYVPERRRARAAALLERDPRFVP